MHLISPLLVGIMSRRTSLPATTSRPPTLNYLDSSQRSRLLKSARKLGDIFGATPHVVDLSPSSPSSPSFPSFPSSPSSPSLASSHLSSTTAGSKQKSKREGRLLVLRMPTIPRPGTPSTTTTNAGASTSTLAHSRNPSQSSANHFANLPSPLPLPQSCIIPLSPNNSSNSATADETDDHPSPNPASPQAAGKTYRKRMAKLSRILGENVPPELVVVRNDHHARARSDPLPVSTASASAAASVRGGGGWEEGGHCADARSFKRGRMKSKSLRAAAAAAAIAGASPSAASASASPTSASSTAVNSSAPPSAFASATTTAITSPQSPLPQPQPQPQPQPPQRPPRDRDRSFSVGSRSPLLPAGCSNRPSDDNDAHSIHSSSRSSTRPNRPSDRRSVSLDILSSSPPFSIGSPASIVDQHSSTGGWNGEWNVKDATKRATALRNLKGR